MATAMFQNYGVGQVLNSSVTGFEMKKPSKISASAVKTDDGMNIILINNTNDTDFFVNFDFEKKYTAVEKHYITSLKNGTWAANYIGLEEIERKTEKVTDGKVLDGYVVPKTTMMAFKLKEVR